MKQTHKKHIFHLRRVGLLGFLFIAFFLVRADAGALPKPLKDAHVLAYATEMSRSALLSGTNTARAANGLAPLSLDSQLNNSAQAKAQDMAVNNYWAHVSPSGTQPWYFFDQAGYNYAKAGENLAYGFLTSQGTVDGWMNSASHRANILGNYYDVGFGIVNTPNYQSSGEQTIVVAHYGTKAMAPTPAPAQPTPPTPGPAAPRQSTPAPPAANPSSPPTEPAPREDKQPIESTQQVKDETPEEQPTSTLPVTTTAPIAGPVQTAKSSRLSVASMLAGKTLPAAALASLVMLCFAAVGYALTHRSAFQHAVQSGEHFVAAHPGIDAGVIAAMASLILLTTYGNIG